MLCFPNFSSCFLAFGQQAPYGYMAHPNGYITQPNGYMVPPNPNVGNGLVNQYQGMHLSTLVKLQKPYGMLWVAMGCYFIQLPNMRILLNPRIEPNTKLNLQKKLLRTILCIY